MCIQDESLTEDLVNRINESSEVVLQNNSTDGNFVVIKGAALKSPQNTDLLKELIVRSYEIVL
jgi:hypothetical protein